MLAGTYTILALSVAAAVGVVGPRQGRGRRAGVFRSPCILHDCGLRRHGQSGQARRHPGMMHRVEDTRVVSATACTFG